MAPAASSSTRYGSMSGFRTMQQGSEQHRRANSIKKMDYNTPLTRERQLPLASVSNERFSAWKYPSPASSQSSSSSSTSPAAHSTPGTSPEITFDSSSSKLISAPDILPSAALHMLKTIDESRRNSSDESSDDTYSVDNSPTTRAKHRNSPSLPYGPMTVVNSYPVHHSSRPLFRGDRASFLRFLRSSLKRLSPFQLGYGFIFLACFLVFLAALTGLGHETSTPTTSLPLPRPIVPADHLKADPLPSLGLFRPIGYDKQQASINRPVYGDDTDETDDSQEFGNSFNTTLENDDEEFEEVKEEPRQRVAPLKAQNAGPKHLTLNEDDFEDEVPSWARPKAPSDVNRRVPARPAAPQRKIVDVVQVLPDEPEELEGRALAGMQRPLVPSTTDSTSVDEASDEEEDDSIQDADSAVLPPLAETNMPRANIFDEQAALNPTAHQAHGVSSDDLEAVDEEEGRVTIDLERNVLYKDAEDSEETAQAESNARKYRIELVNGQYQVMAADSKRQPTAATDDKTGSTLPEISQTETTEDEDAGIDDIIDATDDEIDYSSVPDVESRPKRIRALR